MEAHFTNSKALAIGKQNRGTPISYFAYRFPTMKILSVGMQTSFLLPE